MLKIGVVVEPATYAVQSEHVIAESQAIDLAVIFGLLTYMGKEICKKKQN